MWSSDRINGILFEDIFLFTSIIQVWLIDLQKKSYADPKQIWLKIFTADWN